MLSVSSPTASPTNPTPTLPLYHFMLVPCPFWLQSPEVHPSLCLLGKREGQYVEATDVTGLNSSHLFHITDRRSGLRFLIDTGAQVSVIPPSPADRNTPSTLTLQAVNNTRIRTYGTRSLALNLGLRRTFRCVFVVADVANPILGADFLQHFSLVVDLRHRRLIDALTTLTVQGLLSSQTSPSPSLLPRTPSTPFELLLSEFPTVIQPCAATGSNTASHITSPLQALQSQPGHVDSHRSDYR